MQTQSHKDVVKNITTASQLEGELQLSQAQHGVAVLDVYNAEWGHCKALSETFRRLATDAGDMVHLRFFSVECNAVLESLHNPDDAKAPPRQKGMEFSPETLVAFWSKMLEQRQNHSKPYFVFYKEGKMRTHLEGIDTPKICRIVHGLCKPQNAAAEYITNEDVLRFWESNFSASENEVGMNEFHHAVRALLGAQAAELSGDDLAHITAAVRGGSNGDTVSASNLQAFVGDSGTLRDALLAVVAERRGTAAAATNAKEAAEAPKEEEPEEPDAVPHAPLSQHGSEHQESKAVANGEQPKDDDSHDYPREEAAGAEEEKAPAPQSSSPPPLTNAEEENAEELDPAAAADKETAEEVAALHAEEAQQPHVTEAEDAVAASTIAESSASPSSMPEGVSAERDRETELSPSPHHDDNTAVVPLSSSPPPLGVSGSPDSANAAATPEQDDSTVNQIFTNRWVTVSEEEMDVWNTVAALPLHYPENTTLMADLTNNEEVARAALPASPQTFPTLAEYLAAQGVPFADVNMMCIAADQKVGSESLSYGKLSLILMSCDSEVGKGLVPECEQFLDELSAGTLLQRHQPLAFTALALSASEAYPDECFYYRLPAGDAAAFQALSVNDVFILNALTPLSTAAPTDGVFVLRIIGLTKVIELATTDESDDTMVLSQWFARLRVVEQGTNATTVHFVENVCDEEFQDFLNGYIARLIEDENHLDKKQGEVPADNAAGAGGDGAYEIGDEEEAGEGEEEEEVDSAPEL